jgi:anthranilate synthase component 1
MIDKQTFESLAEQGYNRIPLVKEILADLDTPLSVYLKLADQPWTYLLESVQGGEKWGRYSFIGLPCSSRIEVRGHEFSVISEQGIVHRETVEDPLAAIEAWHAQIRVAPVQTASHLPRFAGGLVGYFGYDTIRYIEPRLGACRNSDPLEVPDILLMVSDAVVVFDTLAGKLFVTLLVDPAQEESYSRARIRLDKIVRQLQDSSYQALRANWRRYESLYDSPLPKPITEEDFVSGFTRAGFESAVNRIKEYIIEGDCMQVVLSQRMSIPYRSSPLELYRAFHQSFALYVLPQCRGSLYRRIIARDSGARGGWGGHRSADCRNPQAWGDA